MKEKKTRSKYCGNCRYAKKCKLREILAQTVLPPKMNCPNFRMEKR